MLIVICGIDGSGKTTQIQMLKEKLEEKNLIYLTKQPTNFYRRYDRFRNYVNSDIKKEISILYELALLSAADRMRHYNLEIETNNNKIIICDRYVFSSYAYFMARGLKDITWLKEINKWSKLPDLTFYLDISPEIAFKRIINREGKSKKKEESDMNIMRKVRSFFLEQPWGIQDTYYIIKADRDKEMIHREIIDIVGKYINLYF